MSSSVIGALRVNLGLDSAQFSKGLKSSHGSLMAFAARAGKTVAGLAASIFGAMQAMGISTINQAAEIENLSRLANATPVVFQEWAAGAKSVGIEQDKLSDILKDTNDKVGNFISTGGGELKDFFENIAPKVGVTAEQFRALSGPDALQLYVDSLQKAGLNQAQMTFYMEAIADEATALLPLLRDGGAGMAEYARKAQAVGAIMDDDMLASLRRGKVALSDMSLAVRGMKNTIGAQAVPVIEMLSAAVTTAAQFFREHAGIIVTVMQTLAGTAAVVATIFAGRYAVAIGTTAVRAIISASAAAAAHQIMLGRMTLTSILAANATRALAGAFTLMGRALIATGIGAAVVAAGWLVGKFMALVAATGGFGNAMTLLGEVASGVWEGIVTSAGAIPDGLRARWAAVKSGFFSLVADLQATWFKFLVSMSKSATESGMEGLGRRLGAAAEGAGAAWDGMRDAAAAADAEAAEFSKSAASKVSAGFEKARAAAVQLGAAVAGTNSEISTLNNGGGRVAGGGAAGEMSDLQRVVKRLNEDIARLKATMFATETERNIFDALREAGVSAASAGGRMVAELVQQRDAMQQLQDFVDRGKSALDSFFGSWVEGAGAAKAALADLLMQIAKVQFAKGALGLLGGTSWGGSLVSLIGSGLGANANGTSNWRGGLTRINERGGEIVDLPSGTRIIPHDVSNRMVDQAAGSGAMAVTIGFDSSTGGFAAYVRDQAGQVVASGISAYDKALPSRVQKISQNPRKR